MPTVELNGKTYEVDENGFLAQPLIWNDNVAADLATTEGITAMTDEHWVLVRYIRDYYLKFGIAPMVRKLCKETGNTLTHVYELFPSGPANGACKVAGLPKPTGCV
jgi:tRNA 2-thiouridine synthesizing protein E